MEKIVFRLIYQDRFDYHEYVAEYEDLDVAKIDFMFFAQENAKDCIYVILERIEVINNIEETHIISELTVEGEIYHYE